MKATITIEENNVRITVAPETELERLSIGELGDVVSVSRSHQNLVLRPRHRRVGSISDATARDESPVRDITSDAET